VIRVVDVDPQDLPGTTNAVSKGVSMHAEVSRRLLPLPPITQIAHERSNNRFLLFFEERVEPRSEVAIVPNGFIQKVEPSGLERRHSRGLPRAHGTNVLEAHERRDERTRAGVAGRDALCQIG